jgi:hypothetical protein
MDAKTVHKRELLVRDIEHGVEDMAKTHVPLSLLVPDAASCYGPTAAATAGPSEQLQALAAGGAATHEAAALATRGAAPIETAAVAAEGAAAAAAMVACTRASAAAAAPPLAEHQLTAAVPSLGVQQQYHEQQQQQLPQVYSLEDLQRLAQAAGSGPIAGQQLSNRQPLAVVPNPSRPFTITMRNGKDGKEYIVAHYEPDALMKYGANEKAAMLCQVYHGRQRGKRTGRISAPDQEKMVMAGMRIDRFGVFSRYAGDEGEKRGETGWLGAGSTRGFWWSSKQIPSQGRWWIEEGLRCYVMKLRVGRMRWGGEEQQRRTIAYSSEDRPQYQEKMMLITQKVALYY